MESESFMIISKETLYWTEASHTGLSRNIPGITRISWLESGISPKFLVNQEVYKIIKPRTETKTKIPKILEPGTEYLIPKSNP